MIRFDQGTQRFTYRVVAVAIHGGNILVHRAEHESSWSLPGGRAELGETAEETIRREMREELSTEIDVIRPLWLAENFFDAESMSNHSVELYFLVRFPKDSKPLGAVNFTATDSGVGLVFQWVPIDERVLAGLPLYPSFLSAALTDLPPSLAHIVHRDIQAIS